MGEDIKYYYLVEFGYLANPRNKATGDIENLDGDDEILVEAESLQDAIKIVEDHISEEYRTHNNQNPEDIYHFLGVYGVRQIGDVILRKSIKK